MGGWAGQYLGAGLALAALSIQLDLSEGHLVGGWRKCWSGAGWLLSTSKVVAGGSRASGARLMGPQLVHPSISQPDSRASLPGAAAAPSSVALNLVLVLTPEEWSSHSLGSKRGRAPHLALPAGREGCGHSPCGSHC